MKLMAYHRFFTINIPIIWRVSHFSHRILTLQKIIPSAFRVSMIRHPASYNNYINYCHRGWLPLLPALAGWRITLTQNALEMTFCLVSILCFSPHVKSVRLAPCLSHFPFCNLSAMHGKEREERSTCQATPLPSLVLFFLSMQPRVANSLGTRLPRVIYISYKEWGRLL